MDVSEMTSSVRDALTVRRVFGDLYEHGGVTVLPVVTVMGAAGGGKGEREKEGGRAAASG